jgi:hypothetical protein
MGKHTGLFRVRKGIFGRSVLQECIDYPTMTGGWVDAACRELLWEDVPYNRAPRALISQWGKTHDEIATNVSKDGK